MKSDMHHRYVYCCSTGYVTIYLLAIYLLPASYGGPHAARLDFTIIIIDTHIVILWLRG